MGPPYVCAGAAVTRRRHVAALMELLGLGVVAFGVGLSGALSPGPLTVLAVREAPRRGWWAGPLATVGHGAVELALVIALALGLAAFVEQGPATAVIAFLGGAILLWMGGGLLRSAPHASLRRELATADMVTASAGSPARGTVALRNARGMSGLAALVAVAPMAALVSVINPYWVLWWATVGTKLTSDSLSAGWAGPGVVFVGHILSDLAWLTLVAGLVASGSRWLRGDGWYRWLLGICGVFLLAIGLFFIASGVSFVA